MKEWMMKHPILTFLIIDEIITMIQTLVKGEEYLSTMDEVREGAGYVGKQIIQEHRDKNFQKEPIGFKAS